MRDSGASKCTIRLRSLTLSPFFSSFLLPFRFHFYRKKKLYSLWFNLSFQWNGSFNLHTSSAVVATLYLLSSLLFVWLFLSLVHHMTCSYMPRPRPLPLISLNTGPCSCNRNMTFLMFLAAVTLSLSLSYAFQPKIRWKKEWNLCVKRVTQPLLDYRTRYRRE